MSILGKAGIFVVPMCIALSSALVATGEPTTQPVDLKAWCVTPTPNPSPERQGEFLRRGKDKSIQMVFLGDSITNAWGNVQGGLAVWNKHYAHRNAANFGVAGETTADTLGHIEGGVLDGLNPQVVVLLIGTNNLGGGVKSDWIAAGIGKIVAAVRTRLPNTRVLVLGIFPRGDASNEFRWRIVQVNELVSKLDDGDRVRFLDLGPKFVDAKGEYLEGLTNDNLHLTPKGYELWADAMQPVLDDIMRAGAE